MSKGILSAFRKAWGHSRSVSGPRWGDRFAGVVPDVLARVMRARSKAILEGKAPQRVRLTTLDLLELAEIINSRWDPRHPVTGQPAIPHNGWTALMERIDGLEVSWDPSLQEMVVE